MFHNEANQFNLIYTLSSPSLRLPTPSSQPDGTYSLDFDTPLPIRPSTPKRHQPKRRQQTQPNRQRLLRLNRSRDRTPSQNHGSQQRELHAVGLALLHAEAAESVERADGAAGRDGGDGTGADVAGYAAAGG